jgi:hypothetical protein
MGLLTQTAILGVETIDVVADEGYFKIEHIAAAGTLPQSPRRCVFTRSAREMHRPSALGPGCVKTRDGHGGPKVESRHGRSGDAWMNRFVQCEERTQDTFLPSGLEDYATGDNPVRVVDVFEAQWASGT